VGVGAADVGLLVEIKGGVVGFGEGRSAGRSVVGSGCVPPPGETQ